MAVQPLYSEKKGRGRLGVALSFLNVLTAIGGLLMTGVFIVHSDNRLSTLLIVTGIIVLIVHLCGAKICYDCACYTCRGGRCMSYLIVFMLVDAIVMLIVLSVGILVSCAAVFTYIQTYKHDPAQHLTLYPSGYVQTPTDLHSKVIYPAAVLTCIIFTLELVVLLLAIYLQRSLHKEYEWSKPRFKIHESGELGQPRARTPGYSLLSEVVGESRATLSAYLCVRCPCFPQNKDKCVSSFMSLYNKDKVHDYLSDRHQPQSMQSDRHQPRSIQSDIHQPLSIQSARNQPKNMQSEIHQPHHMQSDIHHPLSMQSDRHQPQSMQSDIHQPQSKQSARHQPQSLQSDRHQPRSMQSDKHQPQSMQSTRHQPYSMQSARHQPQSMQSARYQPHSMQSARHQPQSMQSARYQPQSMQSAIHQPQSMQSDIYQPQSMLCDIHQPHRMQNDRHQPQSMKRHQPQRNNSEDLHVPHHITRHEDIR